MGHHDHHHHHTNSVKNLKLAFFLNLGFTVIEVIGGFYVNSIAIISDALHDLGDSFSLGLAWFLQVKSGKEATGKFTFGYSRFSLLGALINSVILIAGSVFVISEATNRFFHPETSDAKGMIAFAVLGIIVNGYAAWKLSGGKSMNEKVVSWHLLEDVLGWIAVFIVGVILLIKEIPYLDPALSILITVYVLFNVILRLKETFEIFLQGVPREIDPELIRNKILELENIESLHHFHIWSLEGTHHVFTTHVRLNNISSYHQILQTKSSIKKILQDYHFSHYTIEIELNEETCDLLDKRSKD